MILEKLELKNFKRFKDLKIDFKPGINIIKGPNEKGKSTVSEALSTVLFEDPRSSAKKLQDHKSWATPDKMYEISLQFQDEKEDSFVLVKNFQGKNVSLKNLNTNEAKENYEEISNVIRGNLGLNNPTIFENTVCIKQDMLSILSRGKIELKEALESLITSGRGAVSTKEVQKKLDKEILELSRGFGPTLAKNPGEIKFLQDEIIKKEEEFREGAEDLREKESLIKNIYSTKEKLREISKLLSDKIILFNRNREYFEATLKIQEIEKRLGPLLKELEEAAILGKNLINISEELNKYKKYTALDLKKLERELTRLTEKIDLREKNLKDLGKMMRKEGVSVVAPAKPVPREIFFITAAIFLILGVLGFIVSPIFFVSWAMAVIVFIVPFFFGAEKTPVKREGKSVFQDTYNRIQSEINELALKRENSLKEMGVRDEKDFERKKDELENLIKEKEKKEEKLKGILGGATLSDMENEKLELTKSFSVLESKITPEQKKEPPRREDQERLEQEVKDLTIEVEALKREVVKSEARLENIKIDQEILTKQDEEIDALKKEYVLSAERLKVFNIIKEVLTLSSSETIKKSRDSIMNYVNDCLGRITQNRYQRVHLDEDLNVFVYSNEKRNWVRPEEELSRGTIDQIYLTVRFAFVDFLTSKKKPFLILDDPLVTFDWSRQVESLKVLEELSSKFQIIFLTHSNRYDKWGNNVIALV